MLRRSRNPDLLGINKADHPSRPACPQPHFRANLCLGYSPASGGWLIHFQSLSKSVLISVNPCLKSAGRAKPHAFYAQNKPNVSTPKINTTLVPTKNYNQKPPQSHPKKQTQTNPIPPHRDTIRDTTYACPTGDIQAA